MRYLIMILLLTSTVQAQGLLVNDTDEFTGMQRVISEFVDVESSEGLASVSVSYVDGNYFLALTVVADSWLVLGSRTAYFVIDGRRSQSMLFEIDSNVQGSKVVERYAIDVDDDTLLGAESIKFRINGVVYECGEEVIESINLVKRSI